MFEIYFLIALAVIWLAWASFQDLKSREVDNWIGFSLILFSLGFRFFYSLFSEVGNWNFFYSGLIGLGIFFILGNLFYYSRVFAGGDAKLLMALGIVLPLSLNFFINLRIYVLFLILFLFVGAFYGLIWSIFLALINWKKFSNNFIKRFKQNKFRSFALLFFTLLFFIFGILLNEFVFLGISFLILLFYSLLLFAKSVDEVCMIKQIPVEKLTIGDWLFKDVKYGKNKKIIVKAGWEGLSEKEIKLLKKKLGDKKKVLIRQGIPYIPVFLIAYLILIIIWFFYRGLLLGIW